MSNSNKPILVLGLGNILLGDEGFGVHVARSLKQVELPDSVRVEEGGIGGFNLLSLLEGVRKLLVVDVMLNNKPPGELFVISSREQLIERGKQILSFHQVGVLELTQLGGLIGYEPEVTFIVTQPERIEWSTELSPALKSAVDKAVVLIQDLCSELIQLEGSRELCQL